MLLEQAVQAVTVMLVVVVTLFQEETVVMVTLEAAAVQQIAELAAMAELDLQAAVEAVMLV